MDIDSARLTLGDGPGMLILRLILAMIIFGIAIDMKPGDFRRVIAVPKGPVIGLVAHFLFLPAFTFALTMLLLPPPSVALGMILIGACPPGNLSNFVTHLARGNTALSIMVTATSTLFAVFLTPLNLALWGGLNPHTAPLLRAIEVDFGHVTLDIAFMLLLPLGAGLLLARLAPRVADRLKVPFKNASFVFFLLFIVIVFGQNFGTFSVFALAVVGYVFLHNAVALAVGYTSAALWKLPERDRRAVTFEVGIQNSALGLTLLFAYFPDLGGAQLVAGTWGIWHIISGLLLATIWSRRNPEEATA